jgi:hypothetical protein
MFHNKFAMFLVLSSIGTPNAQKSWSSYRDSQELKLKKHQINQLNSIAGKFEIVDTDQTALNSPIQPPNKPQFTLLVSKTKIPTLSRGQPELINIWKYIKQNSLYKTQNLREHSACNMISWVSLIFWCFTGRKNVIKLFH